MNAPRYKCRECGSVYPLALNTPHAPPRIKIGTPVCPGGAPHGPRRNCQHRHFVLEES